MTAITSVLVANRGEIARRVFRTARGMGLRTIAVFVDADADAPFVREADEAVRLPDSYLDGEAVVEAARVAGADAVHPGYGFLSENASFARAVAEAGMVWIGPSAEVIESMGDKIAAKEAAIAAGVPTLPSSADPADDSAVGYPLLVKASAGGGGKGMRVVATADDLVEAVAAAQREAAGAFGDDRVFLERYVPRSRHIEIQILGDADGNLIHLGERECSIQRRHQKVIEEAPSPFVTDAMRSEMGAAALALGQAMGYQSAGTVEFLVDDSTGEYFFLEVNTRLQVEHPVTEAVTGVDLVRQQLLVAAGEPLAMTQDDVVIDGHAIEARLYAEDPAAGFLPATGTLDAFRPAAEPAVRWDSGVEAGSVVGVHFDPMLAKVIAHGPTRSEAAGRLALALERLHLGGIITNRNFLAATLRHADFLSGATTTDFIERLGGDLTGSSATGHDRVDVAVAGALWLQGANRGSAQVLRGAPSVWRNARLPWESVVFAVNEIELTVAYHARRDGGFDLTVDDEESRFVRVHEWTPASVDLEIDGRRRTAAVTHADQQLHVQSAMGTVQLDLVPRFTVPGTDGPAGGLTAPMPGVVLDVRVATGDAVEAGKTLVVLEAMKMEHHIKAPAAGRVTDVRVETGAQVENGAVLMVIDDSDESEPESS
jgi:propionyl-CoA carboxylase alpha chain